MLDNESLKLVFNMLVRIICAAVCGALIGIERDVHGRAAGLRTHTLVSAGSALFTMASIIIANPECQFGIALTRSPDISRIAAQIVSGVGFLGAGTIVKDGFTVKGLTTAACLWFVAALGMSCGLGLYLPALLITLLGLFAIFLGKQIEKKLHRLFPFQLIIETPNFDMISQIKKFIKEQEDFEITSLNLSVYNKALGNHTYMATFYVDSNRNHGQPEDCINLTNALMQKFPDIITITYKCEG